MGKSFRQTVGSIFPHSEMNEQVMLSGHIIETVKRAEASSGEYLPNRSTTYYNYTGQKEMDGLGIIQGNTRGLIQHNMLLLSERGLPLGLLQQHHWTREEGQDLAAGESGKWEKGLQAINKSAESISKRIVAVEDREGDVYSFLQAPHAANVDLLVRVHQPRNIEVVSSGVVCAFPKVSEHLPEYGVYQVHIRREHQEVELTLRLRAGKVLATAIQSFFFIKLGANYNAHFKPLQD